MHIYQGQTVVIGNLSNFGVVCVYCILHAVDLGLAEDEAVANRVLGTEAITFQVVLLNGEQHALPTSQLAHYSVLTNYKSFSSNADIKILDLCRPKSFQRIGLTLTCQHQAIVRNSGKVA